MSLWTTQDSQAGQPKYLKVGQVEGVVVTNGGTGYTQGAAAVFSAPPAGGVTAAGTVNVSGGAIVSVSLTNPGAGYLTAPSVSVAGGSSAVLSPNIAAIQYNNGEIVFVSIEESQLATNRAKGIKTPGWNMVKQHMDSGGNVRYRVEPLVAVSALNAVSGDGKGDDLVVGDVDLSITTQPAGATVTAPATATFTVVAVGATTYQWQIQVGGVGSYANVSVGTGGTTASYTTAATTTGMNGDRFRCLVGNGGTAQVISKGAKLTVQ